MADAWNQAIYDRLCSSEELKSLLAYIGDPPNLLIPNDLGSERPAIFTCWPVPGPAADGLYIVVGEENAAMPFDTKTTLGMEFSRYIHIYGPNVGNDTDIRRAARIVHDLFHRYQLPVIGWRVMIAVADPPVTAPTGDDMLGRAVNLTWKAEEMPEPVDSHYDPELPPETE